MMRADVVDVLTRTRRRLTPPTAWVQDDFARSEYGPCRVGDPAAECWCLEGAVAVECAHLPIDGADRLSVQRAVLDALIQTVGLRDSGLTLAGWNDAPGRTHDDVLGVLTLTITRLEQAAGAAA